MKVVSFIELEAKANIRQGLSESIGYSEGKMRMATVHESARSMQNIRASVGVSQSELVPA